MKEWENNTESFRPREGGKSWWIGKFNKWWQINDGGLIFWWLIIFCLFSGIFLRKQPLFSLYSSSRGWILIRWTVNNLYFIVYMVFVWYRKRLRQYWILQNDLIFWCFLTFLKNIVAASKRIQVRIWKKKLILRWPFHVAPF